LKSNTKSRE